MKEVTLIYPHQLFKKSPAISKGRRIFLVEESLILSHNPVHIQKLVFHKLSLDEYESKLIQEGYDITRLTIQKYPKTSDIFSFLKSQGVEVLHIVDTTDSYLEKAIIKSGMERVWYDSPLFILSKEEAVNRYLSSKKSMAVFYRNIRKDRQILVNDDNTPVGGKWSLDGENRKKLPKNIELPEDISSSITFNQKEMDAWLDTVKTEKYGDMGSWIPHTQSSAEKYLQDFLNNRFHDFGLYEDAMTTKSVRVFHSTLSPLINVGLLDPKDVVDAAIKYASLHKVPINSLEGFVRQIVGWREFIRAAYECDHVSMRNRNFWKHTRSIPKEFWTGNTGILPVDIAIKNALKYGYTHHIERLMVLGNFMLISRIDPNDVYIWFMAMYVDAYDWVMVPNVYAMSQFADGGIFATKPYISGGNYIKKMSDYPSGDWEEKWTALYWNFIHDHQKFFENNPRLSMMTRIMKKMSKDKLQQYLNVSKEYLSR